ncbi:MAG: 50S ribosomal protein L29 [Bacilli bacterium]|jgi:large subunit ribosomal protein L29|nr:50S ribosomal protein L29 [Bacilli bacterium]MCH4202332.1 50S ribosomal protein L29 [Bacilli bacterium]MCH4235826.1 50S ribosomal protein L29 [Bacilli bacterium]HML99777.1 50S ribosomal protein L29 [Bacilli bacterium]
MKISEIRELTDQDLAAKLYSLKEELFNLRRKQAVGQLENGKEITRVRKDIARTNTVIRERELGIK